MLLTLTVGLMVHQQLSGNRDLQLAVQWSENLGMSIVRVVALTLLKAQFSSGHVIAVGRVLKGSCIAYMHLCTVTLFVCCPSNYSSVMKKFVIFALTKENAILISEVGIPGVSNQDTCILRFIYMYTSMVVGVSVIIWSELNITYSICLCY